MRPNDSRPDPIDERHGLGAVPEAVRAEAEAAEDAELYVEAMPDETCPAGWWHLKIRRKAP